MSLVALALTAALVPAKTPEVTGLSAAFQRGEPVLWLNPNGKLLVNGGTVRAKVSPGTRTVETPMGKGLDLGGSRSGLLLPDLAPLRLMGSLTIATWIYPRRATVNGWQAQIFFRGDDRNGLDPLTLNIKGDGTVEFRMDGPDNTSVTVQTELPMRRWSRVTASFDAGAGEMKLYLGERLVSFRTTDRRTFAQLDAGATPGVGIGNVQNDQGPHNQPFDGILADLRLYGAALEPIEAGYRGRTIDNRAP